MTEQQKNQIARQNGYPSYEAMIAFQRQLAMRRAPQTIQGGGMPTTIRGAVQQVQQHPMHPMNMFKYIGDALKNAVRPEE